MARKVVPDTTPARRDEIPGELPTSVSAAGRPAEIAWYDFVEGQLANAHTRKAYSRALRQFFTWAQAENLPLPQITAGDIGRYLRQLRPGSLPTQKLHLSALRRFFDLLVVRHIILLNPASGAQTERYTVVEGKTAEITKEDVQRLLEAIDTSHVVGLRDRAIIQTLLYTAARTGAVARLKRKDFYHVDREYFLRFEEKGGKSREIPVRHDLERTLLAYLEAAGLQKASSKAALFPTAIRREKKLTARAMNGNDVARMVRRRMNEAGLPRNLTARSFRVAAITDLLRQGIRIEHVQYLAGHADVRTTKLYDRSERRVTRGLIEKISF